MARRLQCGLCGSTFTCGMGESSCWCTEITLSPEALEALRAQTEDCVCPKCLDKFALTSKQ